MKYILTCLFLLHCFVVISQTIPPKAHDKLLRNEIGAYYAVVTDFQDMAPGGGIGYRFAFTKEFGVRLSATYASTAGRNIRFQFVTLQFDYRVEASPHIYLTPSISLNTAGLGLHYDVMYTPVKNWGLFLEPGIIYNLSREITAPIKAGVRCMF
jgi:hypothetical protein